jgi:hypothetical protein
VGSLRRRVNERNPNLTEIWPHGTAQRLKKSRCARSQTLASRHVRTSSGSHKHLCPYPSVRPTKLFSRRTCTTYIKHIQVRRLNVFCPSTTNKVCRGVSHWVSEVHKHMCPDPARAHVRNLLRAPTARSKHHVVQSAAATHRRGPTPSPTTSTPRPYH